MQIEEAITLINAARETMYLPKSKAYISDLGCACERALDALRTEKAISEAFDELDIADMTRAELDREVEGSTLEEIKDNVWYLYSFVSKVCDILNGVGV